jgi:hypothetical protein
MIIFNIIIIYMNIYNLNREDIFDKNVGNSTKNINFNSESNNYAIYNENNYDNVRPIYKDFLEDYSIEQTKDDFNREILLQKNREQNEIVENMGEISITSDPRITKYSDTYSVTPYATFMLTPLSDIDGEDIVSRFDHCYGEWVNKKEERCDENKPCKRIKQKFRIHNPDYTGDHCRDKEGRRLRRGDTKHVFCNHYMNRSDRCNGHGKCVKNSGSDTCDCDIGYTGPNCENTLPCNDDFCNNNGSASGNIQDCSCDCNSSYTGDRCQIPKPCSDNSFCNNKGNVSGDLVSGCTCECNSLYEEPNCENIRNCNSMKRIGIDKLCINMKQDEWPNSGCTNYYSKKDNTLCTNGKVRQCKDSDDKCK